jgi:DMSO/TMAO reductase YedYZ molybdopterin-dependent catalytic subunit
MDPTNYRLIISGMVRRRRELSLEELRSNFPMRTVTATLQCAANRRDELMADKALFPERFAGTLTSSGPQIGEAFLYETSCGPPE